MAVNNKTPVLHIIGAMDDDYILTEKSAASGSFIVASGVFGGAILSIGYLTQESREFVQYTNAWPLPYDSGFDTNIICGIGGSVVLRVEGSTGTTDIRIEARAV